MLFTKWVCVDQGVGARLAHIAHIARNTQQPEGNQTARNGSSPQSHRVEFRYLQVTRYAKTP